jgi:hypothetical protein
LVKKIPTQRQSEILAQLAALKQVCLIFIDLFLVEEIF